MTKPLREIYRLVQKEPSWKPPVVEMRFLNRYVSRNHAIVWDMDKWGRIFVRRPGQLKPIDIQRMIAKRFGLSPLQTMHFHMTDDMYISLPQIHLKTIIRWLRQFTNNQTHHTRQ